MNNPTNEQIKEFWEWCGFKQHEIDEPPYMDWDWKGEPPKIVTLDNLFKYAVPKLGDMEEFHLISYQFVEKMSAEIYRHGWLILRKGKKDISNYGNDPALALFWSIWEVIHG